MAQEEAFLDVLDKAEHYDRRGDHLVITAVNGSSIVLAPVAG